RTRSSGSSGNRQDRDRSSRRTAGSKTRGPTSRYPTRPLGPCRPPPAPHPHPVMVVVLGGDLGDVVRGGADRNFVDGAGHRVGDLPWAGGRGREEPDALEAHVVQVADFENFLIGVEGAPR